MVEIDTDYKNEIIKELCKAVKVLGATSDLLAITGSYGDTLDDKEVLRMLKKWNDFDRSFFEDWTWQKQLVGELLNPQDEILRKNIWITKTETPKLFDIFLKLAKLYFPHKNELAEAINNKKEK